MNMEMETSTEQDQDMSNMQDETSEMGKYIYF